MSLYSYTISHEKICSFHCTHGLNQPAGLKIFPFISRPNDVTGLELTRVDIAMDSQNANYSKDLKEGHLVQPSSNGPLDAA